MLDGFYKMSLDTPIGLKQGTMALRTEADKVYASVDAPVIGKKEFEGQADGDTFLFDGSFKAMLIKITFTAKGEVDGDEIRGTLDTNKGSFSFVGERA